MLKEIAERIAEEVLSTTVVGCEWYAEDGSSREGKNI